MCDPIVQPHFDYMSSGRYPNLNRYLKTKLQTLQKKCILFCLNLTNKAHIVLNEFVKINWVSIKYRFKQCISSVTFNFLEKITS